MVKNKRFSVLLVLLLSLFSVQIFAQLQKGQLVDGIAAVVGSEIVLESDVAEQMAYEKQQGNPEIDRCKFMERILNNKILIHEAKQDTLIENRSAYLKEVAGKKYQQILARFPDEKSMLEAYKFRTGYEMKNAIERIDTDTYYMQAKYGRVTEKADVTPNEVTDFYNTYQIQLPDVKDEVSVAQIIKFPKITDEHRKELIDKLNKIKQDILAGDSFESQARIYSEDTGSATNGGLYTNINKGQMVKSFEATALNLSAGDISDPVESEFGFHIIQLVKRSGNRYDARHILLMATPTAEEVDMAKQELDSIRKEIMGGKITFKEAALKYSDDKGTKYNSGMLINPEDGSNRVEKDALPMTLGYQLAGLNKGDITEVYEDELNGKKAVAISRLEDFIPAHSISFQTDYDRLKQMALNKKKNEMVEKYVLEKAPSIFISIDNTYNECAFNPALKKSVINK